MATANAKNRVYLFRLQMLIIDGGLLVLRNLLDQKLNVQNISLSTCLSQENSTISRLRGQNIITKVQYDLLYPLGGHLPSTADFDITLIICLLRNLKCCGFNRKFNWNVIPNALDLSVEADIYRLKLYRNKISHIATTTGIQLKDFSFKWTEIEQILLRLNTSVINPVPNLQQTIDDIKQCPLDSEAEERIQKEVDEWKKLEKGVEVDLRQVKVDTQAIKEEVKQQHTSIQKVMGKIEEIYKRTENTELIKGTQNRVDDLEKQITKNNESTQKQKEQKEINTQEATATRDSKEFLDEACVPADCDISLHGTIECYSEANNVLPSNRELLIENRSPEQSPDKTCLWAYDTNVGHLLHQNILPSNKELHIACRNLGRRSQTLSNICGMICKQVMDTEEDIIDVWASYCIEDRHSDDTVSIVFVVIRKDTSKNIHLKDYKYHLISQNTCSSESEIVLTRELSDETLDISSKRDTLEKMRKCIVRHADDLLEKHSNINVILPSLKKSKEFYSDNHSIIDEPCIALYVPVKGYIPINEEPFPQELDGFKVDVLEGKFETYNGGPNEFHKRLKMGLAIHANIFDDSNLFGGTLGGFINHPMYKMCGITCAHVVCSSEEMNIIKYCGIKDGLDKPVFQPMNDKSTQFGRVVMAVYKSGDESSSGMEAALFRIEERHPEDGSFPMAFNEIQAGFDENRPLTYNSGVVCEASSISPRTEVFKYGIATGITRGSFALQGAVVRKERMEGNKHSFGYSLKNQLVVLQIGSEPFAKPGDSGALVLKEDAHHDSVAIGIVEGGIKGRVFVTPICDILRAFGCSDLKMYNFKNLKKGSPSADSGVDVDDYEAMDVNN